VAPIGPAKGIGQLHLKAVMARLGVVLPDNPPRHIRLQGDQAQQVVIGDAHHRPEPQVVLGGLPDPVDQPLTDLLQGPRRPSKAAGHHRIGVDQTVNGLILAGEGAQQEPLGLQAGQLHVHDRLPGVGPWRLIAHRHRPGDRICRPTRPLAVRVASGPTVTATQVLHRHGLGLERSAATCRLTGPRTVQARHAGRAPAPTNPQRQGRPEGLQELAAGLDPQQVPG
jgi:hypothetical protein